MTQSLSLLIETKRFVIPDKLIPKLRDLQAETRRYYIDKLAEDEDAAVMSGGMGAAFYLTLDGRVIVWDEDLVEDTKPREAKGIKEMFTAIVAGANRRKSPELLSLLPPRPIEALDCSECDNSGWRQFGLDVNGKPFKIICWDCGGIGWIITY